jgi:hypothetical protein
MERARAKSRFFRGFAYFQGFARRKISSSVVRRPRRRRRSVTSIADDNRRQFPLAELPFETGARGGSKGGGTKAASQVFLQAFPNLGCFRPSFSKQSFGRFVGFQGVASLKNLNDVAPNFLRLPASLQPYSSRRRAAFRRPPRRIRSRCARRFASGYVAARLKAHSWRSSGPDRENFEPSRYSGFWKYISIIFRKEAALDHHCEFVPACGGSPWMKRATRRQPPQRHGRARMGAFCQ